MTCDLKIFTRDGNALPATGKNVLALGTFDGVHTAHARLLSAAVKLRDRLGCDRVGAWCFSYPPVSALKNEIVPQLTTTEEKVSLLLDCGMDFVAVADFNAFKDYTAEDFVNYVLLDQLKCAGAVCGFNHRFGKGGKGNASLLASVLGEENVIAVDEIKYMDETVSSTAIREHIASGEIERANAMLGRSYSFSAPVIEGKHLGRKLHFPTANMKFPKGCVVPKLGIYATVCVIDGKRYIGVSNVGIRPSVIDGSDDHKVNCETFIVDFSNIIYGKTVTVEFHKYLRSERKFASYEELMAQIDRDKNAAIEYFK